MSKIIFGGFIGFVLASAIFVVTVRIYAAAQISIANSCDENGYFIVGQSMYGCKKAVSNG